MSIGAGSMNLFLPVIERVSRLPGKALVALASVGNLILLVIGWFAGQRHGGFGGWFPFGAAIIFSAVLIFFAIRRHRLEVRIDRYTLAAASKYTGTGRTPDEGETSDDIVVIDEEGRVIPGPNREGLLAEAELRESRERQRAAEVEAAHVKNTPLARLEAAQRAAIAAAGGVEKVPHLKDDLRWTLLSAGLTLLSLPFIGFLIIVAVLLWL